MASKIVKKTPTKSIKNPRHHHHSHQCRKKSLVNDAFAAASVVVASINKSIYTCHRHLIKILSKLARIATPIKKKNPRKWRYQLLQKGSEDPKSSIRRALFDDEKSSALSPLVSPEKKIVFLDLDETLVHSQLGPALEKYDFIIRPVIDGERVDFFVLKRLFTEEFLEFLNNKFEIVVFTSGIEKYASSLNSADLVTKEEKSLLSLWESCWGAAAALLEEEKEEEEE